METGSGGVRGSWLLFLHCPFLFMFVCMLSSHLTTIGVYLLPTETDFITLQQPNRQWVFCFVFLVSKLQRQICRLLIAHKINKMKGPVTLWLPPFTVWTGRSSIMTRYQQAQKKLRLRATLSVPALVPWHHCVAQVPSSLSTHLSPRK